MVAGKMKCHLGVEALERILVWPYNKKIAILSNYEAAKQILQAFLISKFLNCTDERIYLVDYSGNFKIELISSLSNASKKLKNIVYLNKIVHTVNGFSMHIHDPSEQSTTVTFDIRNVNVKYLIVTDYSPSRALKDVKGFLRIYCRKRKGRVYELKTFADKVLLAISSSGVEDVFKILPHYLFKALSILKEAAAEYGEYTVKDAIVIISSRIGVSKSFARRILNDLVSYGFVEINRGQVIL